MDKTVENAIRDCLAVYEESDPSLAAYAKALQAAIWQDPTGYAATYVEKAVIEEPESSEKPSEKNWRELQGLSWEKYRRFGPLRAAIDSRAEYVAGRGFSVYSDIPELDRFLYDLFFSYRNKLYFQLEGWLIRMQAEGELFLLLVFDENGDATVRILEPGKIGEGSDSGLLTNPVDVTQTLFYQHYSADGVELIPDICIAYNPELMKLTKDIPNFDKELTKNSRGKGRFGEFQGFNRFIVHWKNLTGILEYKRDTSYFMSVLEAINLYWNAIKWELDHKRAQTAYTNVISFTNDPNGRLAWLTWNKMTEEDKAKTGLTKTLTPGSRVFLPPGMELKIEAPNLPRLSGENIDLLNIAGAGARTPQDLWQGQSAGATYASIKSSRHPLTIDIENFQNKVENFVRFEFLRACLWVKTKMGAQVLTASGKKLKLEEVYKKQWIGELKGGKGKAMVLEVEPCEMVKVSFPIVNLDPDMQETATAFMGSKHTGLYSLGISRDTIARKFGIDNLSREKRIQLMEEEQFGELVTGAEAEAAAERRFQDKGAESKSTAAGKEKSSTTSKEKSTTK